MKDLFSVKEKTVVITGGSSGIGAMIANGFIQNGAKIYITSRKLGALEEQQKNLSSYGECISIQSDLSNSDGINQFYSEIKNREAKIDVLINNAGTAWASAVRITRDPRRLSSSCKRPAALSLLRAPKLLLQTNSAKSLL